MPDATADAELLERANEAVARGAWDDAFELLVQARAACRLTVAELPILAEVAYASGHLDVTIETWERAYADLVAVGENGAAAGAAVRVAMHLLFDTALIAPVRGWLARAERLLDEEVHTPAHAWFAVVRNYERLLSGDLAAAEEWAQRAIEIGSEVDAAAAAIGRVAHARLLILDGDVERGLALLDEAGVAATSGDLDPLSTGVVYCELVCALQGLAQYDLAEQWTEAMERWSSTNAIGSLHGRCRVHRAEILRLRGHYDDAEEQARLACDELRPYLRRELGWPLTELARIQLRRGDLDAAEDALAEVQRLYWDPEPVLSLVRLARGDRHGAASSIRDALERETHVPSKEQPPSTELRRAPLLGAQVEIAVATSDLETARVAAAELETIAAKFGSRSLAASARHARARVLLADGDATGAERLFSEAARRWAEIGAPYETAMARIGLAHACRAGGHEHRAARELAGARAVLDGLVSAITGERAGATATSLGNVFRCEGDYWTVAFGGRAVRVRDTKGMRYLARLLAEPGREFHVLDLAAAEGGDAVGNRRAVFGDAG